MIEFLKLPFSLISEWACLIASILLVKKSDVLVWRLFPLYLFIIVGVESYGFYLARVAKSGNNQLLYNLLMPICMVFPLYVFSQIVNLRNIKFICYILLLLFFCFYFGEWLYQGISSFFYRTHVLYNLLVIALCFIYYYSLFQQEEYSNLLDDPSFWFVTGCIMFFAISISVNIFFAELVRGLVKKQIPVRFIIMGIINVILYGCWIKSFICLRSNRTYTPQSFSQY